MTLRLIFVAAFGLMTAGEALAQPAGGPRDLLRVSLEDLLNIQITSANRKEQRAGEVPAAVFVLTQDDIRRSGWSGF